jgi:SAM-dependent methyltransferase
VVSRPVERSHHDRRRAESFGPQADLYDRHRPSYPPALIDDLVARRPAQALDIGTGTGKAAHLLAARNVHVLGIEIDPLMARVARRHGIAVEVGGFEEWDDAGRRFDLITCAQAWHWIDGAVGAQKAARLLRPEGRLALFWNFAQFDYATRHALDRAYARAAPELSRHSVSRGGGPATIPQHERQLGEAGFVDLQHRQYDWDQAYATDDWLALLRTHSDHSTLPAERLDGLLAAVGTAIERIGGTLIAHYRTEALLAAPPPAPPPLRPAAAHMAG